MVNSSLAALACPTVQHLPIYRPGKPSSELAREYKLSKIVKLASNENPLGCSPHVLDAVQQALANIAHYPDANAYELKQALAVHCGVTMDQIALGNGSNDILDVIARTFLCADDEAIYDEYAFQVYPIAVTLASAKAVVTPSRHWRHDVVAMLNAVNARTKMVLLANPNNPTGTYLTHAELTQLLQGLPPHVLLVMDEAYVEYVRLADYPQTLKLLAQYPNLIVTRTFSKAYGLAGLRVGYSLSHPDIAALLNRVRQPFNVNHLAQMAAIAALRDQAFVLQSQQLNEQSMQQWRHALDKLGLSYIASVANFITVKFGSQIAEGSRTAEGSRASEIQQALLQHGVIVRPLDNYRMPEHLRISMGTREENEYAIDKLQGVLHL